MNGTHPSWYIRLVHFLFDVSPEENMVPLQARVTVIALYAVFLASVVGIPINVFRDYAAGNYFLFGIELIYILLIVIGMGVFWYYRSLGLIRLFFGIAITILIGGLIGSAGGTRGFGFFYVIAGYSVLYFVAGFWPGVILPLIVLVGSIIRIPLGNFNRLSFLNDPELSKSFLQVILVSTVLGVFTVFFQHLLLKNLYSIAYKDTLTGLSSRNKYELMVNNHISRYRVSRKGFAVLGIKVMHFARVNSFRGAEFADQILALAAQRIREVLGPEDVPIRYTGTVFFVLSQENDATKLEELGVNLLQVLQAPMNHLSQSLSLQGLVTITRFPQDGFSVENLTANLMAGFARKRNHPGTIAFFDETLHKAEAKRFVMIEELRHGIVRNEFRLVFHPKVSLHDDRCYGAEILLRWNNNKFGEIEPGIFIPLAEEAGLIRDITRWVARTTVKSLKSLLSRLPPRAGSLVHAINLSPIDLSDPDFQVFLTDLLHRNPLDPRTIEFEITEGIVMDESPVIQETLDFLRSKGYRIAIDDFGTGYSSLSYLHKINAQDLKIDRDFIRQIHSPTAQSPVVDAIISMARSLSLEVTAEGVEYEFQAQYLRSRGCTFAQGWLYSQPLELDGYIAWLMGHTNCV